LRKRYTRKRIVNTRPHAAAKRGKRQPKNAEKRTRGGGNGTGNKQQKTGGNGSKVNAPR